MRVENFPAPGAKVSASEFIITGGGCAANAAVAIARLGGRVAFAGPLGGSDDQVSNRIVTDLTAEGIDCNGAVRIDGGTASVSLILLDAQGEKTIATRRGVNLGKVLPPDAARLVADVDAVLVDNRFPDFVTAVCRAAHARKIPIVIDLDQATKPDDPLLKLGTHVVSSAEALHGTTGVRLRRRLAAPGRTCLRFPRHHRRAERRLLARPWRAAPHAGLQGEGDRFARRRRRLPRRLHARPGGRARADSCSRRSLKTIVGKPRNMVSFSGIIPFFSATRRDAMLSGWISEITRASCKSLKA